MTRVWVEPAGLAIEVEAGESLAEAAWRQGYQWPTRCWGRAACMLCAVVVVDGAQATVPPERAETEALRMLLSWRRRRRGSRLACRLRFSGDAVVVRKRGVRPPG